MISDKLLQEALEKTDIDLSNKWLASRLNQAVYSLAWLVSPGEEEEGEEAEEVAEMCAEVVSAIFEAAVFYASNDVEK